MNTRYTARWSWQIWSVMKMQSGFVLRATISALALCSVLSNPFGVIAASNISVRVICNGHGVPDAQVELYRVENGNDQMERDMKTDQKGKANMSDLKPGTYDLAVYCPGDDGGVFIHTFTVGGGVDESHSYLFRCCPGPGPSGLIGIDGKPQPVEPKTSPEVTSKTESGNGLQTVKFNTDFGRLVVSLPDSIFAGDTISGVVTPEPKGKTEDEQNKNRDVLNGFVIETGGAAFPVSKGRVGPIVIFGGNVLGRPPASTGNLPPMPPSFFDVFVEVQLGGKTIGRASIPLLPSGALITPDPKITPPGMTPSGAVITPDPKITTPPGMTPSGAVITPDPKITPTFTIPGLGQAGRPIVITGPFDGNSDNTKLTIGGQPVTPLAESPHQVVVAAPTNVVGPTEIRVNEGTKETKGQFRNVKVDLTAPKTSLLKGESTELHVEVSGLEGIKEPVPLHLTKGGVVTMQGGDTQTMSIKPAEVQTNGTFTTTRTITGVQAGAWNATATVVVFDVCLQDDNNGNSIVLNRATGDYIFCAGRSALVGANPMWLTTIDFSGGVPVAVGTGEDSSLTMNKSIITFDHRAADRRVLINLSAGSFAPSGTAIVRTTNPKRVFTITDRDTRNNTCTCQ